MVKMRLQSLSQGKQVPLGDLLALIAPQRMAAAVPLGRVARPEDIASVSRKGRCAGSG